MKLIKHYPLYIMFILLNILILTYIIEDIINIINVYSVNIIIHDALSDALCFNVILLFIFSYLLILTILSCKSYYNTNKTIKAIRKLTKTKPALETTHIDDIKKSCMRAAMTRPNPINYIDSDIVGSVNTQYQVDLNIWKINNPIIKEHYNVVGILHMLPKSIDYSNIAEFIEAYNIKRLTYPVELIKYIDELDASKIIH